jgi:hypothetical protein
VAAGSSLRSLGTRLRADHPRAIDRYIDYFGDGAATNTESRASRVPSVDEPPSPEEAENDLPWS